MIKIPILWVVLICRAFYLAGASAVLLARLTPSKLTETLYRYGKTIVLDSKKDPSPKIHSWIARFEQFFIRLKVSKHFFTHFYIVGFIWSLAFLTFLVLVSPDAWPIEFKTTDNGNTAPLDPIVCIIMMNAQTLRRMLECLAWVSRHPSTAKMHLLHYAVGFAFYIITPIAVSCDKLHDLASVLTSKSFMATILDDFEYRHVLAVVLFAYGSLEQNRAHLTLARLRNKPLVKRDSASPYKLPKGGWFDILACPHYFFELVIYAAMLIANWGSNIGSITTALCILVWIIVELGVIADVNHAWYRKTFPKTVPRKWYRMIPLLW